MAKPGDRVANHFSLLDWNGRVCGTKRVEGEFVEYKDGYARVRYKTADLPARFQSDDAPAERVIDHETEPDEVLEEEPEVCRVYESFGVFGGEHTRNSTCLVVPPSNGDSDDA